MSVPEGISEAMASSLSPADSFSNLKSSLISSSSASIPSASSKDPSPRSSLTQAINAASRPYHTQLNRTILARLPLALPPNSSDATVYALGVRHLLPVYHAFETEWAKYVSVEPKTPTMEDFSMEEAVMLSVLIHLNLPALARTDRLRQDVAVLLGVGIGELDSWMMRVSGEEDVVPEELEVDEEQDKVQELNQPIHNQRLDASGMVEEEEGEGVLEEIDPEALDRSSFVPSAPASLCQSRDQLIEHPILHSFLHHIREISAEKPHVLIAYSWVLYMALFNGGRWIRAQLQQARESWNLGLDKHSDSTNETGLSFWYFDGAHDGEDVKDEFKARMRDVEAMLSDEQREDVIREAVVVFRGISRLVEELDEMVGSGTGDADDSEQTHRQAAAKSEVPDDEDYDEEPAMIRSHLLRPRWETPLGYLELLFQVLLPVGLWEVLMLLVRTLQGTTMTVHWPMLRWSGDESINASQSG